MKMITAFATALSFAAAASSGFAGQMGNEDRQAQAPVEMTDAQMDNVTGGALINVFVVDVGNRNNVQVAIPVNAAVAAGVLGGAIGTATQLGRQRAVQ